MPLDLLEAICAIDSRTHEGAEGTIRVADALGEPLRAMGFEVNQIAPLPEENLHGRHLKAIRNPAAPTKLIFIGHTDIILAPEDVPFRVDRAAGRVYGSGVCDMKGGCLVLQEAIRLALEESEAVREAGLIVLLNSAEELPGTSFAQLARDTVQGATACLAFEPAPPPSHGTHGVVAARKGIVRLDLTCFGRAAHAGGNHEVGISAIRELARKIEQIEGLTDYSEAVTANVGYIRGGRVANQVPDEAYAEFEVRAFDSGRLQAAWDAIKAMCAVSSVRSPADGQPSRLVLCGHRAYPPWAPNKGTDMLVQRYTELAAARGLPMKAVSSGGGADASHVADLAPTLDGLGPVGSAMHSTSEWADLTTWPLRVRIAADLIKDLCGNRQRLFPDGNVHRVVSRNL
jgi:glutamate carboxypeptidase